MQLIAVLFALFVCIGVSSRAYDKRARWLIFIAAIGMVLYITWK